MAVLQSTPQEGEEEVDKNEAQSPSDTVVATEQHLSTSSITALKETQGTQPCASCVLQPTFILVLFCALFVRHRPSGTKGRKHESIARDLCC